MFASGRLQVANWKSFVRGLWPRPSESGQPAF